MIGPLFHNLPELYIEFDSRLDALGTFLIELEGDPGAQRFLLRYTDRLRCDLAGESRVADDLRHALADLRRVLTVLDRPRSWDLARDAHQVCRSAFASLKKNLHALPLPAMHSEPPTLEWAY